MQVSEEFAHICRKLRWMTRIPKALRRKVRRKERGVPPGTYWKRPHIELIRPLMNRGFTMTQMGTHFGCDRQTIRNALEAHGLLSEVKRGKPGYPSRSPIEAIMPLVEAGRSMNEVAERLGVSRQNIYRVLRRNGLSISKSRSIIQQTDRR